MWRNGLIGDANAIVVMGPTASGKSAWAMKVASSMSAEIVVCDSVQLYRGFDIGSAKPTKIDQETIPHHMIDLVDCHESMDAAQYATKARSVVKDIITRGRVPLLVVGTGLYLRAFLGDAFDHDLPQSTELRERFSSMSSERLWRLLQRLDPERSAELHPNDVFRVKRAIELRVLTGKVWGEWSKTPDARLNENLDLGDGIVFRPKYFRIDPTRDELHNRIQIRSRQMIDEGLMAEVKQLHEKGCGWICKPMQTIGYLQAAQVLQGILQESEMFDAIVVATRQYAKRQQTWFKKIKNAEILRVV